MPGSSSAEVARSVAAIRAGQAGTGAYVACPAFPPYAFCWFRDGAFVADAMSRAGEVASAEAFFGWCARVLLARREQIEAGGHPHTRYTVDGRESAVEWPHFQLDGFGLLLWALAGHARRHGRPLDPWRDLVELTAAYLERSWPLACTDWWEEQEGLHATTLGCIVAGLEATGRDAQHVRTVLATEADWRVDGSLLALAAPLEVLAPGELPLAEIESELLAPGGGVHRHAADTYYGGGTWLLLTAMHGLVRLGLGDRTGAKADLDWILAREQPGVGLPEQDDGHLLAPRRRDEWVERWGPPPTPLLWSHAMLIDLALALDA